MSDRFVRGWKASPAKLLKLVGTKVLTAKVVLASKANKSCRQDVFMTFGQGYEREDVAEGKKLATTALTNLLEGKLDGEDEYGRVTELVLNHVARPLGGTERTDIYLGLTYHVPNDDSGRWNPFLKALKLPTLAKLWAADNYPFPKAKGRSDTDWPVWTVFDPAALKTIAAELKPLKRASLDALAAKTLSDEPEDADETRDELWQGLERLRTWVAAAQKPERTETLGVAKTGNSLILTMDGDQ
jgi:hypothetical protein